ncbi:disease resistance protein PIK6-NP-like [Phragmites australis]|uniref:disease resistance protein PIK6-NP-like n=1 Tax=Phragmites australis TaxID=29695 RepID=UPI002D78DCDE|nr:disease resistance protein PIK6-NP-like [Phragmites australis]
MDAQGALDSLLGRLTTVLVNEAQLLGGIRGDVEFIKDEMESMNGLLLHLTEAQHRDHQIRAWMKQVAGLTRDCEGNVELYVHYVGVGPGGKGILGYIRRILLFLQTIPVRRQIATRIRELKIRARDVGDRRLRYGVTVPDLAMAGADTYDGDAQSPRAAAGVVEDLRRRSALFDGAEPGDDEEFVSKGIDSLVKWLCEEPPATAGDGQPQLRVFPIMGYRLAKRVALGVYEHSSVASSFDCKAFVTSDYGSPRRLLVNILEQVTVLQPEQEGKLRKEGEQHSTETESPVNKDEEQLASKLQGHLKGKRFLMVLADVTREQQWKCIMDALLHAADGCRPGSTIVTTTEIDQVAMWPSPCKIINARNLEEFYVSKADKLNAKYTYWDDTYGRMCIFDDVCHPNAFAMKMFLHLLYVNPNRTSDELKKYGDAILECKRLNKSTVKQVLMFCYSELPSKYRGCLLYLTIFPKGHIIRATSLARRWIAEGLINTTAASDDIKIVTDEAERYLDVLVTRGFVSPGEISAAGDIKSCTVHHEVREFIARIARDVNFADMHLPPDLAHHLSIHNRIGFQKSHPDVGRNDIVALLPILAESSQWQLLKVLDLEGCTGLNKHHLRSICKILLLKYLSLRNTDITELPKQIKELQCLETLDIRQTKVRVLAKKAIVLPLLKHFLAGHKVSARNDANRFEESFSTVSMPLSIERMENLEILSHAQVSNSDSELVGIAQLLKLRKLGVALHGKNAKLTDLFRQIEKLHRCLRSLSIRIDRPAGPENHDVGIADALPSLPQFIESLNISGVTSGLTHLIQEHHKLAKITLSETYLKEDDLNILGKLHGLRWVRLLHKSYTESELAFKEEEFQSLNFLLVEGSDITNISFVIGAAPKLERIVWSFAVMEAISGVEHLPELKKLELNGDCNLDPVRAAIRRHPNYPYHPVLKHNPHHQRQEDGNAASSSSAP